MRLYAIVIPNPANAVNMGDGAKFACEVTIYLNYCSTDRAQMVERLRLARDAWKFVPFQLVEFDLD